MAQAAARATEIGDLIEMRLDCLDQAELENLQPGLGDLLGQTGLPVILTLRPEEQGGRRQLAYALRHEFWSALNPAAAFIDVELDLALAYGVAQSQPPFAVDWNRLICSHHDYVAVPADLDQVYERMVSTPARILKIAVQAGDVTDCLPVFRLLDRARREGREMIAIAMGPAGVATRILGPSRGAFLTYGSLNKETATASGQVTARDLRELYRIERISKDTQITGIVGLPTGHSLSPHLQNAAFEAAGIDAVYLPFEVRDLASFIKRMIDVRSREIDWNIRGLSVTAPYKSAVMDLLDWIEPAAKEIGAVNTIIVEADGLVGYNTDAQGMIEPLIQKIGSLKGLRCAVIGAGGAARTAAWVLKRDGASVKIFARHKAPVIAAEFGLPWEHLNDAKLGEFDVVVNATPLGTFGELQAETVATSAQLRGARLAYDLVYNPQETQFLREAGVAGCETLGGLSMLITQAAAQFSLWTGVKAPEDVMTKAAEKALRSEFSF